MTEKRDQFKSGLGFIIACVGSAVGMGNIWLFPYRAGALGGAAFLIPYFIFVLLLGVTGVAGEMSFGRAMRTGPVGSFDKALRLRGKKGGKFIGLIPVIGALGIGIGYSVVVGWFLKYLVATFSGQLFRTENIGAYFGELAVNYGSLPWHFAALVITFSIMAFGISKGIEKVNTVLMPVFFVLFIIMMIRVTTLPGAIAGYRYLFIPRFELLKDPLTWVFALGQAFFSLSLAGSGTIVYGSYLGDDVDVMKSAKRVALFDTLAALLAGMVVIPAVFAFGIDVSAGPPLMFISLPQVFKAMPAGEVFAAIFFIAVLSAAVTSLINLFETPVEALENQFGVGRKTAVSIIFVLAAAVGVFIESGDSVGAWMDAVSIYVIPLGALLAGIMYFWVCPEGFAENQIAKGGKAPGRWFRPVSRYVFVGVTAAVYVLGIVLGGIG